MCKTYIEFSDNLPRLRVLKLEEPDQSRRSMSQGAELRRRGKIGILTKEETSKEKINSIIQNLPSTSRFKHKFRKSTPIFLVHIFTF